MAGKKEKTGGEPREDTGPVGAFPAGRKRKERTADKVAVRMKKLNKLPPALPEGVTPLNPGFFALERVRAESVRTKQRVKKRAKVGSR